MWKSIKVTNSKRPLDLLVGGIKSRSKISGVAARAGSLLEGVGSTVHLSRAWKLPVVDGFERRR